MKLILIGLLISLSSFAQTVNLASGKNFSIRVADTVTTTTYTQITIPDWCNQYCDMTSGPTCTPGGQYRCDRVESIPHQHFSHWVIWNLQVEVIAKMPIEGSLEFRVDNGSLVSTVRDSSRFLYELTTVQTVDRSDVSTVEQDQKLTVDVHDLGEVRKALELKNVSVSKGMLAFETSQHETLQINTLVQVVKKGLFVDTNLGVWTVKPEMVIQEGNLQKIDLAKLTGKRLKGRHTVAIARELVSQEKKKYLPASLTRSVPQIFKLKF